MTARTRNRQHGELTGLIHYVDRGVELVFIRHTERLRDEDS